MSVQAPSAARAAQVPASHPARLQRAVCLGAGVVIAPCASLIEFIILFNWSLLQQGEGSCNI